jgi:hypothetical protein
VLSLRAHHRHRPLIRRPTACEDGGRLGESQHSQAPDAPAGASATNQLISSSLPAPVSRFRLPIHLRGSGNRKQPAISFLQIHQLSLKQVHQLSWPLILPEAAGHRPPTALYSVDPRGSGTMMQSCASVGEAPRRQAHSVPRLRSHGGLRVTATSDRCRPFRRCRFEACESRYQMCSG